MTAMTVSERPFDLSHRYFEEDGGIYLNGMQALVRILLDQKRADRRHGLSTAGFVSGYPGSPVGGLDHELVRNRALLAENDIVFQPGQNEELAATAVFGTQMLHKVPGARYDGVYGMWYGKAPGVERAGDAFNHHNFRGVHAHGGVLAVAGDDPFPRSTIFPSDSNAAFYKFFMPILAPGNIQDVLDLGLHGYALSRAAGLWVGFKLITDVADSAARAFVGPDRINPVLPQVEYNGRDFRPQLRLNEAGGPLIEAESEIVHARLELARRYAALNGLNIVTIAPPRPRFGIVASGKTYFEVRQALADLGMDDATLLARGISLLRMRMIFPLEKAIVRSFAKDLEEMLVVEDKRAFLEMFIKELLQTDDSRVRVSGKTDLNGRQLLAAHGELSTNQITRGLAQWLGGKVDHPSIAKHIAFLDGLEQPKIELSTARTPYFCSGCPHNRSLKAPPGTIVGAGIGCHIMDLWMGEGFGEVKGYTQMGGEGAQWVGLSPFTATPHMIQNIGDGTFAHSGSLAVRFAIGAGVNMTYKILYNSTVAMTGGQDVQGGMSVAAMVRMLEAEGVSRVIVTTDNVDRYPGRKISGAEVWHRDRLMEAQEVLAKIRGVTILLHDQECATQKRRLRKRGKMEQRPAVAFINERVCEGCGDCGQKSNCLSVQPVATEFGRKTQIHQSSCNQDMSCILGDCPSFLVVEGGWRGRPKAAQPAVPDDALISDPPRRDYTGGYSACLMGVGGTGVVTVNQVLGTAAFLSGLNVQTYDHTGSSQKAGPVISHLKIFGPKGEGSPTLGSGSADLYLAFDSLVAVSPANLALASANRTTAVVSTSEVPTGEMIADKRKQYPDLQLLKDAIDAVSSPEANLFIDAQTTAERLLGDHMASNLLLVGVAYQKGLLPIPAKSIEEAIRLNGAAVEMNVAAFRWGRLLTADPERMASVNAAATPERRPLEYAAGDRELRIAAIAATAEAREIIARRTDELVRYQNQAYAERYLVDIEKVAAAERRVYPGREDLTLAVAQNLYKLMAYKDEYEVARLLLDETETAKLNSTFGSQAKVYWNFHPTFLRSLGFRNKVRLGPWFYPVLVALRASRRIRGTFLDILGRTQVRRVERELIEEYRRFVEDALANLSAQNYARTLEIARLPDMIRGYEHVKLANVELYHKEVERMMAA
jgi:indolepyruvate ferredoxin oxidoreductase